tara:strand:- start:899 stop:1636 length:738 start_codon:yes stop_codon:yes gene_type:complete
MAQTVSQLLGFTPAQRAAYLNTIAGEAFLGGGGGDIAGVASNLVARKLSPSFSNNMMGVVSAPGQYEANQYYSSEQLAKENLRGLSKRDYDRLVSIAENPALVGGAFQKTGGATSFRGQALLKNKRPGDVMFEDRGNFYFDPVSQEVQAKGAALLGGDPDAISTYQAGIQDPTVQINNYYTVEKEEKKKKEKDPFERFMLGQLYGGRNPVGTTGNPFQQMLGAIQRQGNQLADNLVKQYQGFSGF